VQKLNGEHQILIVEGGSMVCERSKYFKFDLHEAICKYYIYSKSSQVEISAPEDAKTQANLYRHGLQELLEQVNQHFND